MAEPAPQQTDQQRARDELVSARDASDSISVLPTPDEVDAETAAVVTEISRDLAGQLGMNIEVKEDEFVCPISTDVLKDPVWADDGILYEREQIEQYFASAAYQDQRRSPITRRVMGIQLTPDVMLRAALLSHKMQQECMFGAGAECPVPVSMQCAVQALSQFRMAIGRSVDVTPERVLKELMEIDEKLAISDRATTAGFTDAHIRGYLHQHGVQFFEVNQQQFRANRVYLWNIPAVFNTGRHWAADQRTMPQAVLIFFFDDWPAQVNLVDPLDNPGGDEGMGRDYDMQLLSQGNLIMFGRSIQHPFIYLETISADEPPLGTFHDEVTDWLNRDGIDPHIAGCTFQLVCGDDVIATSTNESRQPERYRFGTGALVECNMGENWMPGTVVRIDYAEGGVIHPYQVHLDDGQLVFSPTDTDDDIRAQQQQDQPAAGKTARIAPSVFIPVSTVF